MPGETPIPYRATITRQVEIDHTFNKHYGPRWDYARVKILLTPLAKGAGFHCDNAAPDQAVPSVYVRGFTLGIAAEEERGVLGGFPLTDCRVTLRDGVYHDIDSSVSAFEHATRGAFREAIAKAGAVLLEPVMQLTIATPLEFTAAIVEDIERRRGKIETVAEHGAVIVAVAPQATLSDYQAVLAALSRSQASCITAFSHYDTLPPDIDPPFAPAISMGA